jgi:hypothetical protein
MWYATGPAGREYKPDDPEFHRHEVVSDESQYPGHVTVRNAGGQDFPVLAALIDDIAGEPDPIDIPEWMTPAQVEAIHKLYGRSADGSRSRQEFFTRVYEAGIGSDRYAGINWCKMFMGIEPDGYTHS